MYTSLPPTSLLCAARYPLPPVPDTDCTQTWQTHCNAAEQRFNARLSLIGARPQRLAANFVGVQDSAVLRQAIHVYGRRVASALSPWTSTERGQPAAMMVATAHRRHLHCLHLAQEVHTLWIHQPTHAAIIRLHTFSEQALIAAVDTMIKTLLHYADSVTDHPAWVMDAWLKAFAFTQRSFGDAHPTTRVAEQRLYELGGNLYIDHHHYLSAHALFRRAQNASQSDPFARHYLATRAEQARASAVAESTPSCSGRC